MLNFQTPIFAKMFIILLALPFAATIVNAQTQTGQLFRLAKSPARSAGDKLRTEKLSIAAVSQQSIDLRFTANEIKDVQELSFPLFDGVNYIAVRDSEEGLTVRGADDVTWRGKIEAFPDSSLTLTFKQNILSGLIYAPTGVYEIVPQPSGEHLLIQIDQSLFPECGGAIFESDSSTTENFKESPLKIKGLESLDWNASYAALDAADSGDRIDVLVLYTSAVKNTLGGAVQAAAFAQQAIEAGNTAYRNSRIRTRVRLAGAVELNFTEGGALQTDLTALRNNPEAVALRDQAKADLVALIVNRGDNCGVGSQMSNLSIDFAPRGYSVTARGCAVGNLSLAHELGHNMGLMHNPESATHTPVFPYALGHYVNGSFSTVMSYTTSCPQGCSRIPYFSNPQIFYNNQPTGIPDARDNARALNNSADTVANFRYSGSSLTLISPNGYKSWSRNHPRHVRWSSDNLSGEIKIELSREGGENYETLIAATANDGDEVIIFKGRPTKQARLRISSVSNAFITDTSVSTFSVK